MPVTPKHLDPRTCLPGFIHKRPQVNRYKRTYRVIKGVATRVSYMEYARFVSANGPLAMLALRASMWKQTVHRLYPYGITCTGKRAAVLGKLTSADVALSDTTTIFLRRKPSKRCVKELRWLYDIVSVYSTGETPFAWKIMLQTLPLTL